MPPLKRKRDYARIIIILSGVLPLLLGILFTAIDARHTVQQQQINAANTLLSQAEKNERQRLGYDHLATPFSPSALRKIRRRTAARRQP
ncbi:hypothetical protein OJE16_16615 [Pantoea tagorei]